MFTVYMATNEVNGHRYIGVTSRGLPFRRARHLSLAGKGGLECPKFYNAIRKYGAGAFEWRPIAEFDDKTAAYSHEHVAVADLCPEYNAVAGGQVGPDEAWNKMVVLCLEDGLLYESATAAAKAYGADASEVCKACRGVRRHATGRHFRFSEVAMPEASRKKLIAQIEGERAALRRRTDKRKQSRPSNGGRDRLGRSAAGPLSLARPVVCLDDGMVFGSASQAAEHYDVARSALVELCLGKNFRKTVGGFRFEYVGVGR